jgi:hypothetical protein
MAVEVLIVVDQVHFTRRGTLCAIGANLVPHDGDDHNRVPSMINQPVRSPDFAGLGWLVTVLSSGALLLISRGVNPPTAHPLSQATLTLMGRPEKMRPCAFLEGE